MRRSRHKQAIESVTDQGEQVIRDFYYDLLLSLEARRERMAGEAAAQRRRGGVIRSHLPSRSSRSTTDIW